MVSDIFLHVFFFPTISTLSEKKKLQVEQTINVISLKCHAHSKITTVTKILQELQYNSMIFIIAK